MEKNKIKNELHIKKEKRLAEDAETSVLVTLYIGLFLGIVPIIGFPVTIPELGGSILFIGIILAISSFACSFFMGILFGMPKRNIEKASTYFLNNSLVEISDWLTKIIVGLALVYSKEIPGYINSLGEFVRASSKYDSPLLNIYSIGIVLYFIFLGLYVGYNYMRLVLATKYKYADDNLIRKELEKANEIIFDVQNEIEQKDIKIILSQSLIKEKEQLTQSLLKKINESELSISNSDFEKVLNSDQIKAENENTKLNIAKMIDGAKMKLQKGLIINKEDPQKGQWKSQAINNKRELKAIVTEESKGFYSIYLQIASTDVKNDPLKNGEYILFALHTSFGEEPFKLVKVQNQLAEIHFYSYGSFTVGAFAENDYTELELDLSELHETPSHFKTK